MADLSLEQTLWQKHGGQQGDYAISFDEAGRGPLFGPVTVGAFISTPSSLDILAALAPHLRLRDSKQMSAALRLAAYTEIQQHHFGLARHVGVSYIEKYNINRAIEYAIRKILDRVWRHKQRPPLFLLLDGNYKFSFAGVPCYTKIRGDACCLTLAAASVIAKVSRDSLLEKVSPRYSEYGIAKHKGYGTQQHLEAIRRLGPSRHHRKSFLKKILNTPNTVV